MARYQNLKDYLQNEHIKLIDKAVTEHQNSDVDINGNTLIESLYCTDDNYNDLKMELVVSVDSNETVSGKKYYKVTLLGNLDRKLQDIRVKEVDKCEKSDIRDDNLLSQFILPNVRAEDLERIGNELFSYYDIFAGMHGYGLSLGKIIDNMNAPIFFADLPDDCLGRINLVDTDIKIYRWDIQKQNIQEDCGHAKPGVILLNKKKYFDEKDGELLVTVAHELVHWHLHQRFFKLLVLLGTDADTMNCLEKPVAFADNMPDIQKALCIAEWQANALAMRLAIPSCTVDAANKKIANDLSTYNGNYGDMRQTFVKKFAKMYGVSLYVAKTRNRQLGYDGVDGTCLEYEENGKKIQPAPFYFQLGTLKENETFVIYRKNYEKLMHEDKVFAELINSGRYVYLGYVVCRLDGKYIDVEFSEDGIRLVLSENARNNADECCIKFSVCSRVYEREYSYQEQVYLSNTKNTSIIDLTPLIPEDLKKEVDDYLSEEIKTAKLRTFGETLQYHLFGSDFTVIDENGSFTHKAEEIIDEFSSNISLSNTIIKKYLKGESYPKLQTLMLLCVELGLDIEKGRDLIAKAGYNLDSPIPECKICKLIFGTSKEHALYLINNWKKIVKYFEEMS
ncbi:hypothetical protein SAMN02910265_03070 [Ruminococcus flavefaciens]|uniref:IrrE N-terminal-like domain-containing protein n=1 Tax=Ruminococcus flavefaciens TaxID=1265 RepID=A0A1H6LK81_RUMFL|nr:hypothetical protein [Ruminococcus flavefaciens]SEH85771.1 hypothetical protein SAMN02910265_03070 [Ruminococcus flavefaciens]